MKSIWAHTLVKNEERYLWYAVNSAIEYVDKLLLWDTGSSDRTIEIIAQIRKKYPSKIDFREVGEVNAEGFTKVRQKMLDETDADWVITLDGDEIWWDDSIQELIKKINKNNCESIAVKTVNPVGDIYHYLPESAGQYQIAGKRGHLNLRAFSKNIPGLHLGRVYPKEAYLDEENRPIQERGGIKFLDISYLHLTHLVRSSKDGAVAGNRKVRYEIGNTFPLDYYYPEVFFREKLKIVPSPWRKLSGFPYLLSLIETPPKRVKRII